MGIFGDLVKGALGGFPKKPKVPNAPNVNPQEAQQRSIAGNQDALPGLEELSSDVNDYNLRERRRLLQGAIPGYDDLTSSESDLLQGWLNGQLSPDVASAVRRNANARSFAGGYGGSGMGDNLQARDLGLTSLDLQRQGVGALPGYLATVGQLGMPQQYLPQMDFLNPAQQIGAEQWNETNRYGRDWLFNQLKAIPDPEKAAIANDLGGIADVVGTAALAALGGVGGAAVGMGAGAGASLGSSIGTAGGGGGGSGGGMVGGGWLDSLFGGGAGGAGGGGGAFSGFGSMGMF